MGDHARTKYHEECCATHSDHACQAFQQGRRNNTRRIAQEIDGILDALAPNVDRRSALFRQMETYVEGLQAEARS